MAFIAAAVAAIVVVDQFFVGLSIIGVDMTAVDGGGSERGNCSSTHFTFFCLTVIILNQERELIGLMIVFFLTKSLIG